MFAKIAIPIPAAHLFTYAVPEALVGSLSVGMQVLVPFGRKRLTGWVVELAAEAEDRTIREILAISDPDPFFGPEDLPFYTWIARYYLHPPGRVLEEVLPAGVGIRSGRWLRPAPEPPGVEADLPAAQREILRRLASSPGGLSLKGLGKITGEQVPYADLRALEAAGWVLSEERLHNRAVRPRHEKWIGPAQGPPAAGKAALKQEALGDLLVRRGDLPVRELPERLREASFLRRMVRENRIRLYEKERLRRPGPAPELSVNGNAVLLNGSQQEALERISAGLATGQFSPFLLHGVTGSGKTEVYLRAIGQVLAAGGGAIYLVPEIALTAQLLARIAERFPGREIAVLHSGISPSARYDQWRRLRRGELALAIGARSAIFAPVRNLRLIVVDEEHDPSYKQDDRLRYNARDLALVRGKLAGAAVILGSATPGIQTFHQARSGRYGYLSLPARVDDRPLPPVEVVDMRVERDEKGRTPLISRSLAEALRQTLADGKQALLFLNRRGFHTFLFCPDCGHVFACPACDLALTHHAAENRLKCHHCDFATRPPVACPACRGEHVRSQGAGTERVEEEAGALFPAARIVRMDSDTTARRGETERILRQLDRGEIDILIGTQMITKGHDFPGITLVGVLAADTSLNLPDFRAAERTFQILTQVSGRSGRGDQTGRVVVQTFNPGSYAVRHAREHDYERFYQEELPLRRELGFPPFSRLIGLHFSSLRKVEGKQAVAEFGRRARELARTLAGGKVDVIGPAESPLARLRGRYRWQMLLRGVQSDPLHRLAEELLARKGHGLEIQADVDPVHFM
jgi:primosomal protein N' (replication factor Y)